MMPTLENEIAHLKAELHDILNSPEKDEDQMKYASQIYQEKMDALERKRHMKIRDNLAAKTRLESESTATKSWIQSSKVKSPRDTIHSLQVPGSASGLRNEIWQNGGARKGLS